MLLRKHWEAREKESSYLQKRAESHNKNQAAKQYEDNFKLKEQNHFLLRKCGNQERKIKG